MHINSFCFVLFLSLPFTYFQFHVGFGRCISKYHFLILDIRSLSPRYIEKRLESTLLTLLPGGPGRPRPPGKPAAPCEMETLSLVQH